MTVQVMYATNSAMSRRSGQSLVAIIGAFLIITILSYYSWSLSSENNVLKGTIVMSYGRLKDMTTQKASTERKNLLLSNRMVEMEEARDTEKQNAEIEMSERKKCEKKLKKEDDECSLKVSKKQELLRRCEDASVQRESFLMEALNDVKLKSLDHTAQADVVLAKIKQLIEQMNSSRHDYIALQNKFSDLEKEKIDLQEKNEKLVSIGKSKAGKASTISVQKEITAAKKATSSKKKRKSKHKEVHINKKKVQMVKEGQNTSTDTENLRNQVKPIKKSVDSTLKSPKKTVVTTKPTTESVVEAPTLEATTDVTSSNPDSFDRSESTSSTKMHIKPAMNQEDSAKQHVSDSLQDIADESKTLGKDLGAQNGAIKTAEVDLNTEIGEKLVKTEANNADNAVNNQEAKTTDIEKEKDAEEIKKKTSTVKDAEKDTSSETSILEEKTADEKTNLPNVDGVPDEPDTEESPTVDDVNTYNQA